MSLAQMGPVLGTDVAGIARLARMLQELEATGLFPLLMPVLHELANMRAPESEQPRVWRGKLKTLLDAIDAMPEMTMGPAGTEWIAIVRAAREAFR